MAEMVQQEFGAPDVKLWLSSQKLQRLGWQPTVGLKESYARLIQWLKEQVSE